MNKTKLGINEYFFTVLIFVAAILGPIPMLGMMLYAAVAEKSTIINSGSKIALVIKSGVVLFSSLFTFIEKIVRACAPDSYDFFKFVDKTNYIIDAIFIAAMVVLVIVYLFKGFSGGQSYVMTNAPMQNTVSVQHREPVQSSAPAQIETPASIVCPQCGKILAPDSIFCDKCGSKVQ